MNGVKYRRLDMLERLTDLPIAVHHRLRCPSRTAPQTLQFVDGEIEEEDWEREWGPYFATVKAVAAAQRRGFAG